MFTKHQQIYKNVLHPFLKKSGLEDLKEATACTRNSLFSQACDYLEIPSQVLKKTCFLPCLSILNLTNGTDEEMFTVNMVPDTS